MKITKMSKGEFEAQHLHKNLAKINETYARTRSDESAPKKY